MPNNVDVFKAIANVQRRLEHWDEAIAVGLRAIELDPRDSEAYINLADTYRMMRRFPEALATVDRLLAMEPANRFALQKKAFLLWATGDLQAVEPLLAKAEPVVRAGQALFQRRYSAVTEILSREEDTKKIIFGLSQQRGGDVAAARATYQSAVRDFKRYIQDFQEAGAHGSIPEAQLHGKLGRAYAGLGEEASAIAEGQTAMAIHPTSKDPVGGPDEEYGGDLRSTGRRRSRSSHSQAAAADPRWDSDYSGAIATRPGVGSNPERSSFSEIGRKKDAISSRWLAQPPLRYFAIVATVDGVLQLFCSPNFLACHFLHNLTPNFPQYLSERLERAS